LQVIFKVKLPATVKKRGEYYIASCPFLDVHSQGETEEKALKNLKQALRLFFMSCFERGTLDDVLHECGFKPIQKFEAKASQRFPRGYKSIEVPLPFHIPRKADPLQCHV